MKAKVYGAKASWCQVPRIEQGLLGLEVDLAANEDEPCDFIYCNNPPYDRGDEQFSKPPVNNKEFKIFNVLDIPEHDKNFNLFKLKFDLLKADVVTCISPATQEQLKRMIGVDAKVIWNPIKEVSIDNQVKKQIRCLYVGRANDANKRFHLLEKLHTKKDKIVVLGNERPPFGNFVGPKCDIELNMFYNTCRFVLLPSKFEGLGLPALEAMAAGSIPIVASDNPNSVLCPEFCRCEPNADSIKNKVEEIDADYFRYRNLIADRYSFVIQRRFSKFSIARNIINVYLDKMEELHNDDRLAAIKYFEDKLNSV